MTGSSARPERRMVKTLLTLAFGFIVAAAVLPSTAGQSVLASDTAASTAGQSVLAADTTAVAAPTRTLAPTVVPAPAPASAPTMSTRGLSAAITLALAPTAVVTAASPRTYSLNLYNRRGVRYQDPDYTSCVATSAQMMLNFVALKHTGGAGFRWHVSTAYSTQETILRYERAHMSQVRSHPGSDAHGWKNALNFYGWGSIYAGVYVDRSFSSYTSAVKAAIIAMAKYHKPVGFMGWAGGHAQFINGYKVYGADPATGSTNFRVIGVYITDPLRADGYRNHYISNATFAGGSSRIRFARYVYRDDPGRDKVDHKIGNAEWYRKWVIIAPAK